MRAQQALRALVLPLLVCTVLQCADGGTRRLVAVASGSSNTSSMPHCALVVHVHVPRAAGTFVRALMTSSAKRGNWEFVQPTAFRSSWQAFGGAVLGGSAANCSADWARRHGTARAARAACCRLTHPRRRRVLFEVHATSNYRMFVDDVLARADELRRRYTQCGCALALTTLLRCARRGAAFARCCARYRGDAETPLCPPQ